MEAGCENGTEPGSVVTGRIKKVSTERRKGKSTEQQRGTIGDDGGRTKEQEKKDFEF